MVSGIGSGLGGQFGMVAGATYGTAVTVTRFLEIDSETFTRETQRVMSKGIGRGVYQRSDRVKAYVKGGGGDIVIPWTTKGMGLPLKMALGADTVTTPGGATLERQHLIAPSTAGLFGLFFTAQFGKPSVDGTINPYTYPSCKVTAWEISCGKDGYLTLKLTCDCDTESVATSLASASYASGAENHTFNEGLITINGTTIYGVESFSIKGTNPLATDRRGVGNVKKEPIANGFFDIVASLDFEFEAQARRAKEIAATVETNLVITFTSPTMIEAGAPYKSIITIPNFIYEGKSAAVNGPALIREPLDLRAVYDGTNSPLSIEMHTTDTAA